MNEINKGKATPHYSLSQGCTELLRGRPHTNAYFAEGPLFLWRERGVGETSYPRSNRLMLSP